MNNRGARAPVPPSAPSRVDDILLRLRRTASSSYIIESISDNRSTVKMITNVEGLCVTQCYVRWNATL